MLNHGSIESKSYISKSLFKITVLWHSYVTFKQNTFLPMILICSIYLHNNWITYWVFNKPPGLIAKSCPTLVTPWAVAPQAPPSVVFSRQKYWSGLPFPSPGDLPGPGIEPRSPMLQADSFFFFFLQADSLPTEQTPTNHVLRIFTPRNLYSFPFEATESRSR